MTTWQERAERIASRLKTVREAAAATVTQFVTDAETIGSGSAAGGIRGHFEGKYDKEGKGQVYAIGKTAKLSPELLVGGAFKVLAYSGMGGKGTEHLHAIGNGPLTFLGGIKAHAHFYDAAKAGFVGARQEPHQIDPGALRTAINNRRAAQRARAAA